MSQSKKYTGTCKWFNSQKGFGFISMDDGSDDVFVHQSSLHAKGFRSLAEGEQLEFDIETDNTGKRKAINCTGPNGDYVKGAPRDDGGFNGNGGGGGGRGGGRGGFRGGGGGGFRGGGGGRGGGRRGGGGGYGGGGGGYNSGGYNNGGGGGGGGYNNDDQW